MKDKDDKFILMNMDDKRSKKIAEVMGNETCKKIIDYLTYNSEKSEEDIAKALDMKINTVEYNLKKLLEAGLVEKAKNFFWSKRGKKIPLYKLAKKHIVISPKNSRPNFAALKTIIPVILAVALIAVIAIMTQTGQPKEIQDINTFDSVQSIQKFVEDNKVKQDIRDYAEAAVGALAGAAKGATSVQSATDSAPSNEASGTDDYSTTNVQVEGVDEADIIKNDGKYIYVVNANKVVIVDAYPVQNMEILSEIEFEDENVGEIYINDDKLIVFTNEYGGIIYSEVRCAAIGVCPPPTYNEPKTKVYIYDVSDRSDPKLDEEISFSGNYANSRMIGNYVYLLANQYINEDVILPVYEINGEVKAIEPQEIYHTPVRDYSFQFTNVFAIDIENAEVSGKSVVTGTSQTVYVSKDNIYTSFTKYPGWYSDDSEEETTINKISIDGDEIEYVATGTVPGHLLNQFSMDEFDGNFRVATTVGEVWDSEKPSENNLYVLDEDMNIVGQIEGMAPGEKIYSVRFMGEKAYVVTFKKVDPLFVLSLEDPQNPQILGKLKIPGYSDYLHPIDENHIIGIGKDTVEADEALKEGRGLDFAWYQGIKMAVFDVTDVENPIEMYKVVIGDRGTDSPALYDHKAFLYDKNKELLVLPITLAEIQGEKTSDNQYGDFVFQGAYVYKLSLEDGFELKGTITHYEDDEVAKKSGYYFYGDKNIQRSLYMDNVLYTFSNEMIKANDLGDLDEIGSVDLPYQNNYREPPILY